MNSKTRQIFTSIAYWLKQVFYLLLAVALLGCLFYLRLIPRISRDLWENMNYSQIVITLTSIVLLSLNSYNLLKLLHYVPENPSKYFAVVKNWLFKLHKIVIEILYNFYLFFWNILEIFVQKLTKKQTLIHYPVIRIFAQKFNKKPNFKYYCWFLMGLKFIPKIIFVLAFAIDVLIYQRLEYTFTILPFLLIPLMEPLIIFIFQEFYDLHYSEVCSFIQKKPIIDSELMDFSFIPEYQEIPPDFVKDFYDFFFNHYLVMTELRKNLEFYASWKYNVFPTYIMELLLSSIRLLLFMYILFYGVG